MKDRFPELVKNRRSIRKFSGEHIPDETIDQILLDSYEGQTGTHENG